LNRPPWLRGHIPALDGLRGIAVSLVVLYHCYPKLGHGGLARFAEFGWAGVNLFFVLSGFLITGIILDGRDDPRFFRNFYARRSLRIWPVYVLLLALTYLAIPLLLDLSPRRAWYLVKTAPWPYYLFFVQNLFHISMPGAIAPTWSLAIEEQFYVLWAPIGRRLRLPSLAALLGGVLLASPIVRAWNGGWLTPTHTLIHLDGLAAGSLVAVLMRLAGLQRRHWKLLGLAGIGAGISGIILMLIRGTALADTLLALGFAGMLISAILAEDRPNLYGRLLRSAPLKFVGTVSYGLYMTHILVFVVIGYFDHRLAHYGVWGDYAVVALRVVFSMTVAALLWKYFERPILRLKSRFSSELPLPSTTPIEVEATRAGELLAANLHAKSVTAD
jgi:peptidoglycan/LPS O-acetylase OafA/YrhL